MSLARWEAGLHFAPWFYDATTNIQQYSATDNGRIPKELEFGGQDVTLYPGTNTKPGLPKRFYLKNVNLEVARQFSSGLRLGLGLAWTPRYSVGFQNDADYLNGQSWADVWATFYTYEYQKVVFSTHLDYTFFRRRRFRPYLGAMVVFGQTGNFKFREYLWERSNGGSENIRTITGTLSSIPTRIRPRAGFQYDLSNRISIGTEVGFVLGSGPAVGVGGRWKW